VLREAGRFNVLACGRRWGKSTLGINRLAETAIKYKKPVGWFSPTYKMLGITWRDTLNVLRPAITKMNVQEHRLEFITGGSVEFWSLDNPDSPRGRAYAEAIIDEAAMVQTLAETWSAVIRPLLTDYRGSAWFLSTPRGGDDFKQLYDWGQDPLKTEWASWQMPTSSNPHISPLEIESARQELPQRIFEQEYLALFGQSAGSAFRNVRACATAARLAEPYTGGGPFVVGLDWGQSNDYSVIVVMDAATGRMVDMDRFNQIGWEVQRARVKTMCDKWRVSKLIAESNSIGGPNIEALQRERLPVEAFVTTSASKPPLIESLALAFERGEIAVINDPVLVAELEAYERTASAATGRPQYAAPGSGHDDTVIALALAWYAFQHRGQPFHAITGGPRMQVAQAQVRPGLPAMGGYARHGVGSGGMGRGAASGLRGPTGQDRIL
jgi:hypothetical protein